MRPAPARPPRWRRPAAVLVVLLAAVLCACDSREREAPGQTPVSAPRQTPATDAALSTATRAAWQQMLEVARHCRDSAGQLQRAVQHFLQHPQPDRLQAARRQWHASHQCALRLSPLFHLARANPSLFAPLRQSYSVIDAQPIEPGYLDAWDVYTHSGIVHDISVALTAQELRRQHGLTAETDVVLGLHAMAYLLWGESSRRSSIDFIVGELSTEQRESGLTPVDLPQLRRATLLQLQATLLEDDSQRLVLRLEQPASAVAGTWESLPPALQAEAWRAATLHLLEGLLAELGGETEPHNAFAGQARQAQQQRLQSLDELLFAESSAPLAARLTPAPEKAQTLLQDAITHLTAANNPAAALASLQQLHTALQQ